MNNQDKYAENPLSDELYWALMPPEAPGVLSSADRFVQALLEARMNIRLESNERHNRGEFDDAHLAGQLHATEQSLLLALQNLELSPRQRYIVENVLKDRFLT
ncbi:hypothetical protein [Aeromonas rivipollensis]|uniref:hypothetical protein n=1 Tax=Aeromonas rivipollensis TaxID=948519 RepID=UPI000FAA6B88